MEYLAIIASLNNKPVGYSVGYRFKEGSFYVWMAGVTPEYRRKGVFTALSGYLEKWAKDKEYKSIKIKTWNKRREMRILLVKLGYDIVGFEKKLDVQENRLMHEKLLT